MKKTLLIIAAISIFACKKEEKQHKTTVTYKAYSQNGNAIFKYINDSGNWVNENVQGNVEHTIEVPTDAMHFICSVNASQPDSVFISASANGKTSKSGYRATQGNLVSVKASLGDIR